MPYINAETVKTIRTNLKKALPGYKLSVTCQNHSTVCVNIMAGPMKMSEGHFQVNHFWYKEHHQDDKKFVKLIDTIMKTINSVKPGEVEVEDSDYGSVPNYYKRISVGQWNKPYVQMN